MNIETTKDLKMLVKMRDATISHLQRLEDIEAHEDIKNELLRIELSIEKLEKENDEHQKKPTAS